MKYIKTYEIAGRAPVNKEDPFIQAAKKGSSSKVASLIKSGVDINMRDKIGRTSLMHAVLNSYLMVVKVLLNAGANVNLRDSNGETILEMASTVKIIDELLKAGVNVNEQDYKGKTPFTKFVNMLYIKYNWTSKQLITIIEKFLEHGLNLDIEDNEGNNFYEVLKNKIYNTEYFQNVNKKLEDLKIVEKWMDEHFPQYKDRWEMRQNVSKYNI